MTSNCTREKAFFLTILPVDNVITEPGLLGELVVVVLVECPRLHVKVSGLVTAIGDIWRALFFSTCRKHCTFLWEIT